MKNYKNLNDYYYKNSKLGLEAEQTAKRLIIDEILYQNTTQIFSYLEKMTDDERMSLGKYAKDYDIFRFEELKKMIDELHKREEVKSRLIRLVESSQDSYDKNDLINVNLYLNTLKKLMKKNFFKVI